MMAMMSAQLKKRKASSYMTKSQYIAKLCEERKYIQRQLTRALLLQCDTSSLKNQLEWVQEDIRGLHEPPNLNKKRKSKP